MTAVAIETLCAYSKQFSNLDDAGIATLHAAYADIAPHLPRVTDVFYTHLQQIPKTLPFLEGRLEGLKSTHKAWLHELFTSDYGVEYTQKLYKVGDVHVKVRLPVEFMSGAMTIIHGELIRIFGDIYAHEPQRQLQVMEAVNAALGFSLLVMQESYQSSTLAAELEKFLQITGMSRTLFNNLAKAYR